MLRGMYLVMLVVALPYWSLMAEAATVVGEDCVPCDVMFSKLEPTPSGKRIQHVEMQLRGELYIFRHNLIPLEVCYVAE